MSLKKLLESWKYPSILLCGIGISNVGDWIYLISLNLIVLDIFANTTDNKLSLELLKKDWNIVLNFSRRYVYIMIIYFLFSCVMVVMTTALDSLEAAFAKEVLYLSDHDYGFLVSIAGAGIVVGSFVNALFVKKLAISWLMGLGSLFVSVGYIIYAFSNSFFMAALGFFVLAFFISFANTGFLTFYQNNIPVDVMGRIGSVYGFIEAILVMMTVMIFGVAAQLISIQFVVIAGSSGMLLISITLCIFNFQRPKNKFYESVTADTTEI